MPAPSWGKCVSCDNDNVGLIDDHCSDCHNKMFLDNLEPCQLQPGDTVFPMDKGRPNRGYPITVTEFNGGWNDIVVGYYADEPARGFRQRRDAVINKKYC